MFLEGAAGAGIARRDRILGRRSALPLVGDGADNAAISISTFRGMVRSPSDRFHQ